jgi:hypothetical protein
MEHIRTGPGEAGRHSARIGTQAQRKQIGQTERCLDMQVIIGFKAHADCECRRGKALQRLSRATGGGWAEEKEPDVDQGSLERAAYLAGGPAVRIPLAPAVSLCWGGHVNARKAGAGTSCALRR